MVKKLALLHSDEVELGDEDEAGTHFVVIRQVPSQPTDRVKKNAKKSNEGDRTLEGKIDILRMRCQAQILQQQQTLECHSCSALI